MDHRAEALHAWGDLYPSTRAAIMALLAALTERMIHTASAYAFHRRGEGQCNVYDLGLAGRCLMVHERGCAAELQSIYTGMVTGCMDPALMHSSNLGMRALMRFLSACEERVRSQGLDDIPATWLITLARADTDALAQAAIDSAVTELEDNLAPELEQRLADYLHEAVYDSDDCTEANGIHGPDYGPDDPSTDELSSDEDNASPVDHDTDFLARVEALGLDDDAIETMMTETMASHIRTVMRQRMQSFNAMLYGGPICAAEACLCDAMDESVHMPWETTEDDGILHVVRTLFAEASATIPSTDGPPAELGTC